jgi:hypothetical protein
MGVAATGLLWVIFFRGPSVPVSLTIPDEDDVEALGRMIASENPRDSVLIQQAIAWTAVNYSARLGKSVASVVMPGGIPGPQKGRYASTANPSTDATRAVAFDVLSGAVPDPTGGAIQFDAPATQDALYRRWEDNPSGKAPKTAAQVAASRLADGKIMVTVPGVSSSYMRWWKYA